MKDGTVGGMASTNPTTPSKSVPQPAATQYSDIFSRQSPLTPIKASQRCDPFSAPPLPTQTLHISPFSPSKSLTNSASGSRPPISPPESPSRAKNGLISLKPIKSWEIKEVNGKECTVLVSARRHEQLVARRRWSWLLIYEYVRHLHAGLPERSILLDSLPPLITAYSTLTPRSSLYSYLSDLWSTFVTANPQLSLPSRIELPKKNLECELPIRESKEEMDCVWKKGTVQFCADLVLGGKESNLRERRLEVILRPPSIAKGCRLFRQYGSDRFIRLRLDKQLKYLTTPDSTASTSESDTLFAPLSSFLSHPLHLFGRTYRPFCYKKEGIIFYFCTSGPDLRTISLIEFVQGFCVTELNGGMRRAKWAARFELGLTPTTQTIPIVYAIRTPDLMSDTLTLSYGAMKHAYMSVDGRSFQGAPGDYLPSCIEGSYTLKRHGREVQIRMVWRLDYTTVPHVLQPHQQYKKTFQCRLPPPLSPDDIEKVVFDFQIKAMDGTLSKGSLMTSNLEQIEWVMEETKSRGVVMTDGCSLISSAAMIEIKKVLDTEEGARGGGGLPACVQARCGPAKGVWTLAPRTPWDHHVTVEMRDSQVKYNDENDRKEKPYWFEVHSVPHPKSSAKLNKQFLQILTHCGVKAEVFRMLLRSSIKAQPDRLIEYWDNPLALLHFLETNTSLFQDRNRRVLSTNSPSSLKPIDDVTGAEDEDEVTLDDRFADAGGRDPSSAAPNTIVQVAVDILQQGWLPRDCFPLADKLKKISTMQVHNLAKKTIIELDRARNVLVVADHLGVLEEGQIFYQSSEPIALSPDGLQTCNVVTGSVLVSRPPAILPSDFQKVVAVDCHDYRHYFDVIILSAKGERPMSSLLSGGDYDGDKLIVITEKILVEAFDPLKADHCFVDAPFEDEEYFKVDKVTVGDVVQSLIDNGDEDALSAALISSILEVDRYAQLSELHNRLSYVLGLSHTATVKCAHLFAKALDGHKQGMTITNEKWTSIHAEFKALAPDQPEHVLVSKKGREDLHLDTSGLRTAKRPDGFDEHVMDGLHSEGRRGIRESEKNMNTFLSTFETNLDPDLFAPWAEEQESAVQRNDKDSIHDLLLMVKHTLAIYDEYSKLRSTWARESETSSKVAPPNTSPSKSASKSWSNSSPEKKQQLLDLTRRFWSIVADERFRSAAFWGLAGAPRVRKCMASLAYTLPLLPNSFPKFTLFISPAFSAKFSTSGFAKENFVNANTNLKKYNFGFDMAHRDLLALKASKKTQRAHAQVSGNAMSVGLGGPTVYQGVLNVYSVKKSLVGSAEAATHARVRPISLLPPEEIERTSSPTKRQKTT